MTGSVRTEWFDAEYMARVGRAAERALDITAAQLRSEIVNELRKTTGVKKGETPTGRSIFTASMPGTPPGSRTGQLRGGVNWNRSGPLSRRVGVNANVPYAAIHELGGVIQHPGGTGYLTTNMGAIFLSKAKADAMSPPPKRTRPHAIPMPARPYLRPTLARMAADGTLDRVFNRGFRQGMKMEGAGS